MTRRPLPEALGAAFSVREAREAGMTRWRTRGPDLRSTAYGARSRLDIARDPDPDRPPVARERDRVLARARELATVLSEHAFFAGITAAMVHGIPLPAHQHSEPWRRAASGPRELRPLVVGVHKPRSVVRRANVRGIHVDPALAPVVEVDGMRVTDRAATWAMLGTELEERDLVIAADHLIRIPRHPGGFRPPERAAYATRDQLTAAIGRRRGAERLRRALARARTGASSPRETELRLILVEAGLPEPKLDYDVVAPDGSFVACLDLAYPALRVGIEYDGSGHRTQAQFERDIAKREWLSDLHWDVVHFTAADFRGRRDPSVWITKRVRDAIARQERGKV
ncbi:hypothetical protein [Microbacterium stercoris]|uniref:DUF559 domain-containing protein n=1 Tax=Microbacterium stercoris TaxID=2820289 RepID=A0A939QHB5_9MICO|nr:hypothetical protein [Microbacterium stercoris]MBO3662664.1 hypothetical protein [Microbacterium stercoris]